MDRIVGGITKLRVISVRVRRSEVLRRGVSVSVVLRMVLMNLIRSSLADRVL